jgi:hypothetical protein
MHSKNTDRCETIKEEHELNYCLCFFLYFPFSLEETEDSNIRVHICDKPNTNLHTPFSSFPLPSLIIPPEEKRCL